MLKRNKLSLNKYISPKVYEKFIFFKKFIYAPSKIGSVTPSSKYLMYAMLNKVSWNECDSIVELGAGTGVFTYKIAEKMKSGRLLVFEIDENFRSMIKTNGNFDKKLKVTLHSNAEDLSATIESLGLQKVDCILSSLPFTALPRKTADNILDGITKCLKSDGKFVAYQYSHAMRKEFEKRFGSIKISFVLRNIPPAFVYECILPKNY
ncbi:MAG: methyltransferase domain-containing protein [Synergistaceae bacterium]|nr:methyltransferase domain-containing protein [Synergistaceae bacterium]